MRNEYEAPKMEWVDIENERIASSGGGDVGGGGGGIIVRICAPPGVTITLPPWFPAPIYTS